jgi:hypothetical protein
MMNKKDIPRLNGTLRSHSLQIPENIWKAKGIVVLGRRIKSVIFTTDLAIIRNCNADAVLAVYPFTPQQIISQTIVNASSIPVFAGVGGGTTTGLRSVLIARDAEAHGAFGVVVNAPTQNDTIMMIKKTIDIPIIVTVLNSDTDIQARLDAGASILNVSAAAKTPQVVREIRKKFPTIPIIATGGPTEESIAETIEAGANTISYTPPSTADIFASMMENYRNSPDDASKKGSNLEEIEKELKSSMDII